ncbi:peptidyl-tRNA hydrolase, mitochondrial-like isoform X2 [Coffea arabica]|uniref:Peptidyl-tRNA hydrolase, mitochondrial-like isoform X2 n=1 Tax=Coffea arabica TaxID=13443 RepID=A0ABM4W0N4_COFAR
MLSRLSRHYFCSISPQPWLFVGLGNPGDKFKGTRHNVGFEMIDAFAEAVGIPMDTVHCKALFGKGFVNGVPVFLAKPQTYMNLSGESSGPLAAYYKLPLNRVIVFHDDMNLPCGVLRLHHNGGHGSHNGLLKESTYRYFNSLMKIELALNPLVSFSCANCHYSFILPSIRLKSVIHNFRGNTLFPRLRIGIGRPPGQMDPKAFLLQKFNAAARERHERERRKS